MTIQKNTDDFFNETNELSQSWFRFDKIGDSIKGTLIRVSDKPEQDVFPAQKIYELKTDNGIMLVGISVKKVFIINAMRNVKIGQIVGFKYESDYQTDENKKKGMSPAKTIKVYRGGMDEEFLKENQNELVNTEQGLDETPPPEKEDEDPTPDFLK